MHKEVKHLVLSVCQSVCPVKNFDISTFTRLKDCCTLQGHGNVYVPDRDQSSSLLCISSSTLVLSTIFIWSTTWIQWRAGMCWLQAHICIHQPPRSQDGEKLGSGLGTRQRIRLGAQVSEIWRVIERSYAGLIRSISCFLRSVSYSMKFICWQHQGVWQAGTSSVGKYKTFWSSIPTTTFTIIVWIPHVTWCTLLV